MAHHTLVYEDYILQKKYKTKMATQVLKVHTELEYNKVKQFNDFQKIEQAPAPQNLSFYLSLRIFSNKELSQSYLSISLFENILTLK